MESNTMQLFQIGFFHLEIWLEDSPMSMCFLKSFLFIIGECSMICHVIVCFNSTTEGCLVCFQFGNYKYRCCKHPHIGFCVHTFSSNLGSFLGG